MPCKQGGWPAGPPVLWGAVVLQRMPHALHSTSFLCICCKQGGRQSGAPVLREDVMLQRMPHMRAGQQSKAPADVDPFAPELHGPDYWFQQVPFEVSVACFSAPFSAFE